MNAKPAFRRPAATDDFDAIVDYYLAEAGSGVATRFSQALNTAIDRIGQNPGIGSERLADLCGVSGLRTRPVRGFPYLIC